MDEGCNGSDATNPGDADCDGYESLSGCGGTDCEDSDDSIHPGATDKSGDGIDQDCDRADG